MLNKIFVVKLWSSLMEVTILLEIQVFRRIEYSAKFELSGCMEAVRKE